MERQAARDEQLAQMLDELARTLAPMPTPRPQLALMPDEAEPVRPFTGPATRIESIWGGTQG